MSKFEAGQTVEYVGNNNLYKIDKYYDVKRSIDDKYVIENTTFRSIIVEKSDIKLVD